MGTFFYIIESIKKRDYLFFYGSKFVCILSPQKRGKQFEVVQGGRSNLISLELITCLRVICARVYRRPAAFKSASILTTCSGIGGGVGKWSPVAWKPFSSATQLTVKTTPSGLVKEYDPLETVPISSGLGPTCFWLPLSETLVPSSLS